MALCAGCERPIFDRYLFQAADRHWHAQCLVCIDCRLPLVDNDKCYSRHGNLFCRADFLRRFGTKCAGCEGHLDRNELVRRARDKVFHVDCFCCSVCRKRLDTGEELYILNGSKFICKHDYLNGYASCNQASLQAVSGGCGSVSECEGSDDLEEEGAADSRGVGVGAEDNGGGRLLLPLTELSPPPGCAAPSCCSSPKGAAGGGTTNGGGGGVGDENGGVGGAAAGTNSTGGGSKRRGPRTTIKAKQLETLKAAFAATPKPTRHIREQLAQETGLNMRVIQVWFQNRRSKERRMKQLRYGGYRPGRRNRNGGLSGADDGLGPAGHMFQDMTGSVGEAYFHQNPAAMGYFCPPPPFGHLGVEGLTNRGAPPQLGPPPSHHPQHHAMLIPTTSSPLPNDGRFLMESAGGGDADDASVSEGGNSLSPAVDEQQFRNGAPPPFGASNNGPNIDEKVLTSVAW